MYWFFVFAVIIGTTKALDPDVEEKCFDPVFLRQCCKTMPPVPAKVQDNIKECSQLPGKDSCERDICMAVKAGYGSPEGKLLMDKAKEETEKNFMDNPDLQNAIKKECLEKDFNKFGAPDTCEVKKWKQCIEVQLFKSCSDWDDQGPCEKAKEITQDCVKLFQ